MLLGVWCSEITMVILLSPWAANQNLCVERHLKSLWAIKAPFPLCSAKKRKEKASKTPCLALRSKTKPRAWRFRFAKIWIASVSSQASLEFLGGWAQVCIQLTLCWPHLGTGTHAYSGHRGYSEGKCRL